MDLLSIILLLGLVVWGVFAVRVTRRQKKKGCGGDCSHCGGCH